MPALLDDLEEIREVMLSRGMFTRELKDSVRASSIVEADRSFEAVVSTERVAQVIDWSRYEVIDEVLVARGGQFPAQAPLLDSHIRHSSADVMGSALNFRLQDAESQWLGRGIFAKPAGPDDPVERIWARVRDGHLRGVSIGYMVLENTDIEPGQKKLVAGKYYTATARRLRVSTKWAVHELSTTPIGADPLALIRSRQGNFAPVPKTRSYFR